jgi:tetratricopeptide (TPR) repeat protein
MAFDCIATRPGGRERCGYRRHVTSRSRVFAVVLLAAVVAAGIVVVGVLATRSSVPPSAKPLKGKPTLSLYLGVRTDPEARALNRAQQLYADRRYAQAAKLFGRYSSLEAQVGSALAAWPSGTLARLQGMQSEHPRSSLVALHLGLAYYWARQSREALQAWQAAARDQPDTPYAVRAGDLLHPQFAPGLPRYVPSFEAPLAIRVLPAGRRLAALRRAAAAPDAHAKLLYGSILQELGRPVSAERQFAAAAKVAPTDPDTRVAAAVGRFDKAAPVKAFSTLGPLTQLFPHAQTVRFHLGVLLLWSAQVKEARRQLTLARNEDPKSTLGVQAAQFLSAIGRIGTG